MNSPISLSFAVLPLLPVLLSFFPELADLPVLYTIAAKWPTGASWLRTSDGFGEFSNKIMGRAGDAAGTGLAVLPCQMRPTPGHVRLDDLLRVCRSGERINHALMKEMLELFIQDNRRRIAAALGAAETGNDVELRGAVHALKGSAALIGAEHLRDLAANLEFRVASGTVKDAHVAARQLQDEYAAVVSTLRSIYPDLAAE